MLIFQPPALDFSFNFPSTCVNESEERLSKSILTNSNPERFWEFPRKASLSTKLEIANLQLYKNCTSSQIFSLAFFVSFQHSFSMENKSRDTPKIFKYTVDMMGLVNYGWRQKFLLT